MASEDLKRKLIENTKKLLLKNATITIKDIADASYVNIAAVNYHFGSKEKLMRVVIEEVINELKAYILNDVMKIEDQPIDEILETVIDNLYTFAIDNIGLLNYLFLSQELQSESTSLLIKHFFSDNDFTKLIYKSMAKNLLNMNEKEIQAKYILIFSSFCIPMFFQISQAKLKNPIKIEMFLDPEFRKYYMKSLIKMI